MKVSEARNKGLIKPVGIPKLGEITSNLFSDKLKSIMKDKKVTYKELAEKIGITEGAVGNWANGQRFPKDEIRIAEIADILGVSIVELFPDTRRQKEMIVKDELKNHQDKYKELLPQDGLPNNILKVELLDGYAGAGSYGESQAQAKDIYFDTNTIELDNIYKAQELKAIKVFGDSMTPYVNENDLVLFSPIAKHQATGDGKYIISTAQGLQVKNVSFSINGDITISSTNADYKDTIIKASESQEFFDIVGRVVGRVVRG